MMNISKLQHYEISAEVFSSETEFGKPVLLACMHGRTGFAASGSRGLANQESHVGIWGVSSNGGNYLLMDGLFHGKSMYKWMITGGIPILGNPHIWIIRIFTGSS